MFLRTDEASSAREAELEARRRRARAWLHAPGGATRGALRRAVSASSDIFARRVHLESSTVRVLTEDGSKISTQHPGIRKMICRLSIADFSDQQPGADKGHRAPMPFVSCDCER